MRNKIILIQSNNNINVINRTICINILVNIILSRINSKYKYIYILYSSEHGHGKFILLFMLETRLDKKKKTRTHTHTHIIKSIRINLFLLFFFFFVFSNKVVFLTFYVLKIDDLRTIISSGVISAQFTEKEICVERIRIDNKFPKQIIFIYETFFFSLSFLI